MKTQNMTRYGLMTWAILIYGFLYLPVLLLVLFSFNTSTTTALWKGFTLQWYVKMFQNHEVLIALKNSLLIAVISTIIAIVFGTLAALAMHKYVFRGKNVWNGIVTINLIVPEIVAALSLLMLFVFMKIRLNMGTIIIGHTVYSISLVIIIVRARLHGFNQALEEVSLDLGATPVQTFRYVTLPLIMPGIVSAALLCFVLSFDDFVMTFFLQGTGMKTLPVYIYTKIKRGLTPEVNAVSTLLLAFTGIVILMLSLFERRNS